MRAKGRVPKIGGIKSGTRKQHGLPIVSNQWAGIRRSYKLGIFRHKVRSAEDKSFSPHNRLVNQLCTFSIRSVSFFKLGDSKIA